MNFLTHALSEDQALVQSLLRDCNLPGDISEEDLQDFFLLDHYGQKVGCAALSIDGNVGILRSVAISPILQGKGLGTWLSHQMIQKAAAAKIDYLFLATWLAFDFWIHLGFAVVEPEECPPFVQHYLHSLTPPTGKKIVAMVKQISTEKSPV
jgi:arsenate reductase